MKNKLKFLSMAVFAVLFSMVSCQKEEIVEEFPNPNPNSSMRVAGVECIDFEFSDQGQVLPFVGGDIPSQVYTDAGSGPINISGINPNFLGTNAAMIFNSVDTPLTGGDTDLGTPNEDFGGPGIGAGGELGALYENNAAQGNVLIISEDLDSTDPDDLAGAGEFDINFGACGPVTVHGITIIDVEGGEGTPYIQYFDNLGAMIGVDSLPKTGDNGVAVVSFNNPVSGVDSMHVHLRGSGAIDNLCIEKDSVPPPPSGCTHTIGYWKTHAGFGPQADVVTPLLPIWLGTNGGANSLAVTDRFIARNVLKMKTYGHNKNGITKLYAQLLASKLSIKSGADGTPVATYISDADAFLANNDWNDWNSLSSTMKQQVLTWKRKLDKYNNGLLGVPKCP